MVTRQTGSQGKYSSSSKLPPVSVLPVQCRASYKTSTNMEVQHKCEHKRVTALLTATGELVD